MPRSPLLMWKTRITQRVFWLRQHWETSLAPRTYTRFSVTARAYPVLCRQVLKIKVLEYLVSSRVLEPSRLILVLDYITRVWGAMTAGWLKQQWETSLAPKTCTRFSVVAKKNCTQLLVTESIFSSIQTSKVALKDFQSYICDMENWSLAYGIIHHINNMKNCNVTYENFVPEWKIPFRWYDVNSSNI